MSIRIVVSEWRGTMVGYVEMVEPTGSKRYADRRRLADATWPTPGHLSPASVRSLVEALLDQIDPPERR